MKHINLIGLRFNRLLVISSAPNKGKKKIWQCLCDCGNQTFGVTSDIKSGKHASCGCLQKERASATSKTHGMSKTVEYKTWCQMRERCTNPLLDRWPHYGGRGISVCERWDSSFENFLSDMGMRPSTKHSIDRIDNNGNYCPENCKWSTQSEQQSNKQSSKKYAVATA